MSKHQANTNQGVLATYTNKRLHVWFHILFILTLFTLFTFLLNFVLLSLRLCLTNIFKIKYLFKSCCSSSAAFFVLLVLLELGHGVVGSKHLRVSGAGVEEVFVLVGVFQVASQSRQVARYLKVPQSLGHHLWIGGRWWVNPLVCFWLFRWGSRFGPKLGVTFTMWSLGSRLQSAKVRSLPSRYLREDTQMLGSSSSSWGWGVSRNMLSFNREERSFFSITETQTVFLWWLLFLKQHFLKFNKVQFFGSCLFAVRNSYYIFLFSEYFWKNMPSPPPFEYHAIFSGSDVTQDVTFADGSMWNSVSIYVNKDTFEQLLKVSKLFFRHISVSWGFLDEFFSSPVFL